MFGIDDAIGAGLNLVTGIIDRVFPDKEKADAMKLEVLKMQQAGELAQLNADLQLAVAQAATNTEEAKSGSVFVAGWRPCVGWVCGAGFAVQYVILPLANFVACAIGHPRIDIPMDTAALVTMLGGLLGLGGMRTYEKIQGVSRAKIAGVS